MCYTVAENNSRTPKAFFIQKRDVRFEALASVCKAAWQSKSKSNIFLFPCFCLIRLCRSINSYLHAPFQALHRSGSFINSLLQLEELGFRSGSPVVKKIAFIAWKSLIDNFALNPGRLKNQNSFDIRFSVLYQQIKTVSTVLTFP